MKLLLVDDEVRLVEALSHILKKNGYAVDTALNGDIALELAITGLYDLIVLDRMLPGLTGLAIVKELRQQGIDTPVLFLTAKDSLQDRVEGLDAGADDYLVKPFSSDELLARLRALTRRQYRPLVDSSLTVGELTLHPLRNEVQKGDALVLLTVKESLLLELLMRNFGQVITKELILSKVWGYSSDVDMANVDLYIHYLRKKLNTRSIRTIRGIGYCLQEETHVS